MLWNRFLVDNEPGSETTVYPLNTPLKITTRENRARLPVTKGTLNMKDNASRLALSRGITNKQKHSSLYWITDTGLNPTPETNLPDDIRNVTHLEHPTLKYLPLIGAGLGAIGSYYAKSSLPILGGAATGQLAKYIMENIHAKPMMESYTHNIMNKYSSDEPHEIIGELSIAPTLPLPHEIQHVINYKKPWINTLPYIGGLAGGAVGGIHKGYQGAFAGVTAGSLAGTALKDIILERQFQPFKERYINEVKSKYSNLFGDVASASQSLLTNPWLHPLNVATHLRQVAKDSFHVNQQGNREFRLNVPIVPFMPSVKIFEWNNPKIKDVPLVGKAIKGVGGLAKGMYKANMPENIQTSITNSGVPKFISDTKTGLKSQIQKVPDLIDKSKAWYEKKTPNTVKNIVSAGDKALNVYGMVQLPALAAAIGIPFLGLDKKPHVVYNHPPNKEATAPIMSKVPGVAKTVGKEIGIGLGTHVAISGASRLLHGRAEKPPTPPKPPEPKLPKQNTSIM